MKKLFALLAVALGVVACQKDQADMGVNLGGEQEAFITVNLPEVSRAGSEFGAFENGVLNTHDLRYILEIYYGENCYRKVQYTNEKSASFPVRLAPGREYKFAVWADFVEKNNHADLFYKTSNGLDKISILDGAPMTEARDAFYGKASLGKDDHVANMGAITLTRPFAKIRVVTTDIEDLNNLSVALPTEATVAYDNNVVINNKFNALTGVASSDVNAVKTYTFNYANTYAVENGEMTLFADYLFVNAGATTKFVLTVTNHVTKSFNTEIPVVANQVTTIKGDILTNGSDIRVEIEDGIAGEDSFVQNVNAAQSAIDNAIANTTIYLEPGVDYGTLLIRPVAGAANTITDCDYLVYRNEMLRKVENLTIIGAPGATVDAIKVVAGHIEGSTGYVVDIENLVIDSVEFTDKHTNAPHSYAAPIFIDLTYTNVDGLTVKNCKLEGNNDKMNFVYVYGSGNPSNSTFATAAKNIVLEDNYVDGIARLCELRQTENVTITNNTIKNTALHAILLPVDNGTYSGNVTITENHAEGINERFVRMAGAGDAVVVIKDNYIANYLGEDADYIKVTDGTNVTIENNTVIYNPENKDALKAWLTNAVTNGETNIVVDAQGANIGDLNYGLTQAMVPAGTTLTIRNAVIEGRSYGNGVNGNVIFDGCTFTHTGAYSIHFDNGSGKVIFKNSKLYGWNSFGSTLESVSFENCALEGNGTYALIRSYVDLTLTNCTIDTTNANHADEWPEGIETVSPATLTETNVAYVVKSAEKLAEALNDPKVKKILLFAGEYDTIVAQSNKLIEGTPEAKVGCVNLNGANNLTLKNINFDAAKAKYGYDNNGAKKDFAFSNIITGDNVNSKNKGAHNLVIDGCTFTGAFANRGAAISFTDYYRRDGFSGNITIKNCVFDNTNANYIIYGYYTGDSTNGHGNFVIENNIFKTPCYVGPIYLGRYASNIPVQLTGNTFESVTSLDNAIYVQDHSSYGVSINASNNTFAN